VLLGAAFVVYGVWFVTSKPSRGTAETARSLQLPRHVTPFTVLALLQEVGARGKLDAAQRQALAADVARIEASHFGRTNDPALDLEAVARTWLARAV
jgi:hypothetical protein